MERLILVFLLIILGNALVLGQEQKEKGQHVRAVLSFPSQVFGSTLGFVGANPTGVQGGASPQHRAGGEVTSSESLSELLLLLSSSPSPCWGEERGTSITGNPGTLLFEPDPQFRETPGSVGV